MKTLDNGLVMTIQQFADATGIGINSAYQIARIEGFPALQVGRRRLVIKAELDSWLKSCIGKKLI